MSPNSVKVSAAESVVMEALWKRHPLSADDVIADVAKAQGWTEATVKTHLLRIFAKLDVNDRTHAVIVAMKRGLFTTGE